MLFWIITSALALTVAATLALVLLRVRTGAEPAAAYDLRVYRDQLGDVDRDLARGVIAEADAERIRTEISRRILAADTQVQLQRSGRKQSRRMSVLAAVALGITVIAGSLALYRVLGAPGYGDLALSYRIEMASTAHDNRPGQAEAEADLPPLTPLEPLSEDYLALVEKLRATVAERPNDLQGHMLLARQESVVGNLQAAYTAQARVLELKGDAVEAADYIDYANMLILAAGGYVSPEAETALRDGLDLDPKNGVGRYYWGLMLEQNARPDLAFRVWQGLLMQGPADAPWMAPIRSQIQDLAMRAGVDFDMPPEAMPQPSPDTAPGLRGPSAGDVAAAGDMDAGDRGEMIRGMVEGLSERLATEGGTPGEWAQLIGALGVLGETDRARAIYAEAETVFAGNAEALDTVAASARRAGIIE